MYNTIRVMKGDILKSSCQTLVNTVNCVGVMGKGIALAFKENFPAMFKDYKERCDRNEIVLGRPYLYKSTVPPWILNFPTKDHWRSVSKLIDIEKGLNHLLNYYKNWGITSIAFPPLGCGQGQLEWRIVGPTLYRYLKKLEIPVELYAPYDTPYEELRIDFLSKIKATKEILLDENVKIDPAWVAIIDIISRIKNEPYHWPIGSIMFQKIAFVATREGLPTGIEYEKGSYGPFSKGIKNIKTKLVNNGLIFERRDKNWMLIEVGKTFDDAKIIYKDFLEKWESELNRVVDLFLRIQNAEKAEIATTIMFAADLLRNQNKSIPNELEIFNEVMDWKKKRKPPINNQIVAFMIRNLAALNWLEVKSSYNLPVQFEYDVF